MKVGVTLFAQNYTDWDRFEAVEAGASDAPPQSILDAQIYQEQFHLGDLVEPLGFDSLWTVEHHFTPYTMVNNPAPNNHDWTGYLSVPMVQAEILAAVG